MKYKDFKKMSADEMKEVKGGLMPPHGKLVQCSGGTPFCLADWANELDCGPTCVVIGICNGNAAC